MFTLENMKTKSPLSFIRLFCRCGIAGWCMEIIYTSLQMLQCRNLKLTGTTSLWMFPIYGMAAFLRPLFRILHRLPIVTRGSIYALCIYTGELLSGTILSKKGICPWDYNRKRWHLGSHIRADFFPLWFLAGLFFEHFVSNNGFFRCPQRREN